MRQQIEVYSLKPLAEKFANSLNPQDKGNLYKFQRKNANNFIIILLDIIQLFRKYQQIFGKKIRLRIFSFIKIISASTKSFYLIQTKFL